MRKSCGTVYYQGLGQEVFALKVIGNAAHAATHPEKGINAIKVAARIVSALKTGKWANGDTLNIGVINGGVETNVVPAEVVMEGEVRSFSKMRLAKKIAVVKALADKIAKKSGAVSQLEILEGQGTPVFEAVKDKVLMKLLEAACKKAKVPFAPIKFSASCDASYLSQFGVPTVGLSKGGENTHATSEQISLAEMKKMPESC